MSFRAIQGRQRSGYRAFDHSRLLRGRLHAAIRWPASRHESLPAAGIGDLAEFRRDAHALRRAPDGASHHGLLKQGARRDRLEAKIFGGARTIARFSNVGEQNAAFARQFLMDEGIRIVGEATGGDQRA